ncbi:MAG: dihydrolipoyl dehydrogenase [Firmicutes bacterium]|nr:dihydrolipoyl dehydrogenase [Bacillota bacterium]
MSDFDLIVIGAGPGGYEAALHAAELGMKTAVIEMGRVGGTCLNRGCVPTKALLHSSGVFRSVREGTPGVLAENVRCDVEAIFAEKDRITETLSGGVEGLLKKAKVTLIRGRARITAPGTVEAGGSAYTADRILIATGSVPVIPPIPGLDLPGVMSSNELLKGTDHVYESIVIIGGGVIGVELATFYADLGSRVTIVEGLDRLLPNMDKELGQNLGLLMKKRGVTVHTGAMVERVSKTDGGLTVSFSSKKGPESAEAEAVLCAIGRRPYFDGLFAEGLEPGTCGRSIKVDERFETGIPGIYAIGDVSSKVQLAHVAAAQGIACVDMMAGRESDVDLSLVPSCIYSRPEIAVAGLTEAEAQEKGIAVKTGKCVMGGNARTLIADPGRSFMKLVAYADTGKLAGAQLMCENATDMISELTQAIANGLTARDLLRGMRPHPTFEEAMTEALLNLVAKLGN